MKKNAMCQIAVGLLTTCLAGAALAAGGPGDECNSDNIQRSAITKIWTMNDADLAKFKNVGLNYERTIYNSTSRTCVVKFRGDNWMTTSRWNTKPSGMNAISLGSHWQITIYGSTENDITYERAKTKEIPLADNVAVEYARW